MEAKQFGTFLAEARKALGLTQADGWMPKLRPSITGRAHFFL